MKLYTNASAWLIALGIGILSYLTNVWPQNPEWIVFDTENSGIADNRVSEIEFDPEGNVWIGHSYGYTIRSGISVFDGVNWTIYNADNSGLPSNNVSAIAFDNQGNAWIGTGSTHSTGIGVAMFDGQNWTVYSTQNSDIPIDSVVHGGDIHKKIRLVKRIYG